MDGLLAQALLPLEDLLHTLRH